MTLIYLSIAWVAGIYAGSLAAAPAAIIAAGVVPALLIPLFRSSWRKLALLSLCLFALLGGAVRFQADQPRIDEGHVAFYRERGTVSITGMVADDPDAGDRTSNFRLAAAQVTTGGVSREVSGDIRVRVPAYGGYSYGDVLRLTGKLQRPTGSDSFDYEGYLARQDIYAVMEYPSVTLLQREQGAPLLQWLHGVRAKLASTLSSLMPEPQAGLAKAILLGMRGGVPSGINQALIDTGTAHILAISGMNITMVLGILASLFVAMLGRRHFAYVWPSLAFMWLYVALTGMQPPVIRAAIMGTMFFLADFVGRQRDGATGVAFAAAIMVGVQPQVLWQASFQLSFLAMGGLVLLGPPLQRLGRDYLARVFGARPYRGLFFLTDSIAVTLAATVSVYPAIAYYFRIVSLAGLPATLLVVPALAPIMVASALAALLGIVWLPLGWLAAWAAWIFLGYLVIVVSSFNALPLASIYVGSVPAWPVWGYYAVLAAGIPAFLHRSRLAPFCSAAIRAVTNAARRLEPLASKVPKPWVALAALVAAGLVWAGALYVPDGLLHVSVLDTGQGDAVLVQTADGKKVLIDGGPGLMDISQELGKKLPFWDRTIDAVVLTQPQADHLIGLLTVLDRYNVGLAIEPGLPADTAAYRQWQVLIGQKGVPLTVGRAGTVLDLGNGATLEVLHPPARLLSGTEEDNNNNALVSLLTWKGVSFLLTSDIQYEAELELLGRPHRPSARVLKVAHHGSRTSTSARFLDLVTPDVAVVSAGAGNRFGHPHPEVVERLRERVGDNLYTTAERGTVEFITDGSRLWVKTER